MSDRRDWILAFLLLGLGACAGPGDPRAAWPSDHLSGAALAEATAALTALGPRLVATPAEQQAADRLSLMLRAAGVDRVVREPFTWDAWQPGAATITVGGAVYPAEPLSPSPPTDGLSGLLVDADEDFSGAIALFSSDDGSRAGQFVEAVLGGALAFVRVTEDTDEGEELIEVGHTLAGSTLPALAVSRSTGRTLRWARGHEASLDIQSALVTGHVSDNLVATVEGTGSGVVYVVAHYDSWHPSESAFDNALGVGTLLLLARQLAAGPRPAHSVVFLATSGEEQGLRGAISWVEAHEAALAEAVAVITLDIPWSGAGDYHVMASDDDWLDLAFAAADAEGLDPLDAGSPGVASDHAPFAGRGVPAVWCTRQPDPRYHTAHDTLDRLDLDEAAGAARAQWRLLAAAAGVPGG